MTKSGGSDKKGTDMKKDAANYPLDVKDIRISDPFILADEASGQYYMYSAYVPGAVSKLHRPNVTLVYTSKDLIHWSKAKIAFDGEAAGFWGTRDFWAPECHFWHGSYYLISSFRGEGTLRRCQCLKADSPLGPFRPIREAAAQAPSSPAGRKTVSTADHASEAQLPAPASGCASVAQHPASSSDCTSPADRICAASGPVTPEGWQCLDGTLYEDPDGKPWLVFCHEWLQVGDGQIAAVPLSDDLDKAIGDPLILFRASDAPWAAPFYSRKNGGGGWVTDGPFLYRMEDGSLAMLWSNFSVDGYAVGYAKSASGQLFGPWVQEQNPLFFHDGGHAMLFHSFDGQLLMALHCPNTPHTEKRLLLFSMEDKAGRLAIINELTGNWYNGAGGSAKRWVYKEPYTDHRGL